MIKKISLALLICLLLAALSGCGPQQLYPVATQGAPNNNVPAPTIQPTAEPQDIEYEGDPQNEEDKGVTNVEISAFAGSSPLPLDPIDMPTPTPRPPLTFEYQTYEATKLGIKFDAPVGWIVDDAENDTFTLTEPIPRDSYTAFITIHKSSVSKQYNENDMKQEVVDMLNTIGSTNYDVWEPTYTDSRTLMDQPGVYANYSGTLVDGTRVRGRVHVTCIDKVLYSVHMSHAANYNTDYLQNHGKLRDTMTLTK